MQIQDFLKEYEAKSDEELLLLAIDPSQLTDEANSALLAELRKRRLSSKEIQTFQEQEQKRKRKDEKEVGQLWVSGHYGLGKKRFGKADYKYDSAHRVEEFTTTIFFLIFWFPLIPLGTYRIKRRKSFFANRFGVIEKLPLNWSQVTQVWAVALIVILLLAEILKRM